jgi:hypothetical protein
MATFDDSVSVTAVGQQRILLQAEPCEAVLGGQGQAGALVLLDAQGNPIVSLIGGSADMIMGGHGVEGDIMLFQRQASDTRTVAGATIHLDGQSGDARFGGHGANGDIWVFPSGATNIDQDDQATIHISGQTGDIMLLNADAAEDFDVASERPPEPGDVMVLGDQGLLQLSQRPYDRRVAGVVAGAGGYRPGIVLGRDPSKPTRVPIALVGRVFCKAQATDQPIAVGDLLTTSPRPGHAMRATDHNRAFGAVLGKAMGRLETGSGLVPMIVTLQ